LSVTLFLTEVELFGSFYLNSLFTPLYGLNLHQELFYFTHNRNMFVLLNGFLKKTNKTPKGELEKAISYRSDYEKRCNDE